MSNIVHISDRRGRQPIIQTARDLCIKLVADLDMLAQQLDHTLGRHLEGEAEKRHQQHCATLAQMLHEARKRVEAI